MLLPRRGRRYHATKQKAEADAREVEPAWGDFVCPLSDLWTDAVTPST